jgi:hypothetical protein
MPSNGSKWCHETTGHDREAWRTKERECQNSWGSRAVRARECDEVTEEQECHDRG